ncbi:hypothetical protein R0J88_23325, partial [Pseudoalteromonas sp. SIMBA_162]
RTIHTTPTFLIVSTEFMMSSRPQSPVPGNGQADECVTLVATATLPTRYGTFTSYAFRVSGSDAEHLALVMGDVGGAQS